MSPPASDRASVGSGEKVPVARSADSRAPSPASSAEALNRTKRMPCREHE